MAQAFGWHGFEIRSELALGLPPANGATAGRSTLRIAVDAGLGAPQHAELRRSPHTGFGLHADACGGWLVRPDLRIRIAVDTILLSRPPERTEIEYLNTRVLALWLHLIGAPPIHASAVARAGRALAFMGPSGAGKSTLSAAMRTLGYAALADDLLPIAPTPAGVDVHPGHGYLHLWPASARALVRAFADLPRVPGQGEKRRLAAGAGTPAARLAAIVLLQRSTQTRSPRSFRLSGTDALFAMLAHGQMAGFAELLGLGGLRMQRFGAALAHVQVHRLEYPDDLAALPAACAYADELLDAVSA